MTLEIKEGGLRNKKEESDTGLDGYTPSEHFIRYLLDYSTAAVAYPFRGLTLSVQRCSSAHHCCNVWLFALLSPSCEL